MTFANIIALMLIAFIGWWLSGFDPRLADGGRIRNFFSRAIRCGFTLVLMSIFWGLPGAINTLLETLALIATLALLWCHCLAEMCANVFHRFIDPEDKRVFDPGQNARELDVIAHLIKTGRRKKAIRLCKKLKTSGDSSAYAMETLLEHLGVPQSDPPRHKPLTEAYLLRSRGKFNEAKVLLNSLLAKNPADADAALMLAQLYAQDLRQPGKAEKILRDLKKQPGVPPVRIEWAEHSLQEWGRKKLKLTAAAPTGAIDDLLGSGHLGTAIEILEQKTAAQPENFGLWIKFAEVHAVHCGNLHRAGEIIRQIENNSGFSEEQIQTARAKLQEWRNLAQRPS